jgi:hypothetical protein
MLLFIQATRYHKITMPLEAQSKGVLNFTKACLAQLKISFFVTSSLNF